MNGVDSFKNGTHFNMLCCIVIYSKDKSKQFDHFQYLGRTMTHQMEDVT